MEHTLRFKNQKSRGGEEDSYGNHIFYYMEVDITYKTGYRRAHTTNNPTEEEKAEVRTAFYERCSEKYKSTFLSNIRYKEWNHELGLVIWSEYYSIGD